MTTTQPFYANLHQCSTAWLAATNGVVASDAIPRRIISASYYSVFHMLIHDSVWDMYPSPSDVEARKAITRAFDHAPMYKVSANVAAGAKPDQFNKIAAPFFAVAMPDCVKKVANAFCLLQTARIKSDYKIYESVTLHDAVTAVANADQAIADWSEARLNFGVEAKYYLAALFTVSIAK